MDHIQFYSDFYYLLKFKNKNKFNKMLKNDYLKYIIYKLYVTTEIKSTL